VFGAQSLQTHQRVIGRAYLTVRRREWEKRKMLKKERKKNESGERKKQEQNAEIEYVSVFKRVDNIAKSGY
jgi:hypothetical protein